MKFNSVVSLGSRLLVALAILQVTDRTTLKARGDTLDQALLKQAPKVIRYLQDKGYRNVGVLKFRVQKGNEPAPSDNAGTLNLTLADRLELALVLADDFKKPIGIIHNASAVAATVSGANHLTREGRLKLFQGRYNLAWGTEKAAADAFLTGVVQVSSDLQELHIGILAFDREKLTLEKVAQFAATTETGNLAETGESFLLRGGFDDGKPEIVPAKAVAAAAQVRNQAASFPIQDGDAPVGLEIRYNDQPVPVAVRDGRAFVPEPREGQKVELVLRRTTAGRERFGVVLKVNGENTLYRQRLRDVDCRKWILDAGDAPSVIRGFQLKDNRAEEFRVLSRAVSRSKEMYYGADVGTISMVVFRERRGKDKPPPLLTDEAEDLVALTRGVFPIEQPKNLGALKSQLRDQATRGLIEGGEKIESQTRTVSFKPDPIPVMVATIVYYRPQ